MFIQISYTKFIPGFTERYNDTTFIDRVYCLLTEDEINLSYGSYISKVYKNGMIKVLKSLNIYQTTGRGSNKIVMVHPRIKLAIDTTIVEAEHIGRNIVHISLGKYDMTPFIELDLVKYTLLAEAMAKKELGNFSTYIIYNPLNDLYKIGRSKNVYKRFINLKQEYSKDLQLLVYNEKDYESEIHFKYRELRNFGEWFNLDTDHLLDIINQYKFVELNAIKKNL